MRIAIFLTSLCAEGTPVLALEMARVWRQKGVDFRVCTFQDEPKDMADEFRTIGVEVDSLGMTWKGYGKFPRLVGRVRKYCQQHRIDAVLSFPFGWHSYVAWGAGLAGIRRVVAHAGNYPPKNRPMEVAKLRATLAVGDLWHPVIACCSDHVRGGLVEHLRMRHSRLQTVYNGIQLSRFDSSAERATVQAPLRIGMVARFEGHKDQPTVLRALQILKARGVDVIADMVGDGTRRAEFEALASDLAIADQVCFTGVRRDVPQLLQHWDAFVFSVSPDEGLGIALIEALAAGVPVIASDVGACREVLDCPMHGMLGTLFPFGDAERLADAIVEFKTNPGPWWKRASLATSSVQARFSIEAMADKYLALLGHP